MVLILAVAGLVIAYIAFIVVFGMLCSIARTLKRIFSKGVSPRSHKKTPAYIEPRRDYSHVYDDTPSIYNPDLLDVLDGEDAGWDFGLGGYPDERR